ncbi:hypothetical protein [Polynucleobacter sp. AP-Sving-400A-A2]|uniref:hypothetical protein n=1 Tax=Polynucleobacter sp. AP-Sving-400A-A2 TaxID=2081049 RepID=UPI001BFEA90C|nr:hypothetical protein [Polynucleobacter sp. AP-Sving-400A-A2]QWE15005.1 hypothetical protein C2758_02360 [Polynucleobacter sp. AP-Sving-400A-A2]
MTLAIKIGASSNVYDNIALANSMRGNQKLSITGTGAEIYSSLSTLLSNVDGIGAIKSTSDIVVTAAEVATNKAVLLKLGTKSLVLQGTSAGPGGGAAGGVETNTNVATNFTALDSVYTKFKSLNISGDTTIDVSKLSTAVNLGGMGILSGKTFNISGTGADLKTYMSSILKNINKIGTIEIAALSTAEFTADQLKIVGDKLTKANAATSTVLLKDTADRLLTTDGLALISKYNNTNINPLPTTTTVASFVDATDVITATANHKLNTGDVVSFNGTANGDLVDGDSYYVRKLSDSSFALYDTYAHAVATSSVVGKRAVTTGLAGTFSNQVGIPPTRVTTLNDVQVTNASVAQADRFVTLTTLVGSPAEGANIRPLANIVSKVDIADTVAKLNAGTDSVATLASSTNGATSATNGIITTGVHGFTTGDRVTYSSTGTALSGLVSGANYYVGVLSSTQFVLYSTKADALAADTSTPANAYATSPWIVQTTAGAGTQTFTASALDKTMSNIGRLKDGAGSVGRVTILGSGSITSTSLSAITAKIERGDTNTKATYQAKAVDVNSNLQALYDNKTSTLPGNVALDEIVVSDGSTVGKKAISLSYTLYNQLQASFLAGMDNPAGNPVTPVNKNYAFTVTGAGFANTTTLQGDKNVATYAVTGATYTDLSTAGQLVAELGKSKLKTLTSVSISDPTQRSTITTILNAVGNPVDRAKLKLTA